MSTKKYVSLDKLGVYDEKIKQYIDTAEADALAASKEYSNSLSTNYDAAGSASTAQANAKTYTDEQIGSVNEVAAGIKTTAEKGVADAAKAQSAADKAQADVDALETYVGTIPEGVAATDVIGYINEKTSGIATDAALGELQAAVTQLGQDVDAIEADYLKAADKTELESEIATAKVAGDAAQTYAEGVANDLADEVKARGDADTALDGRIATLEGQITGLTGAMHFKGVVDEVPEDVSSYDNGDVIVVGEKEYVFNGTEFVEFGDVSAEGERIAALETHATTYEAKVATLEGKMTTVEGTVATKAEQSALDEAVEALEGADTELGNRISTLEGKFGGAEGSVEDQIADAQAAAIAAAKEYTDTQDGATLQSAQGYTDGEIDKVEATIATLTETVGTKADASDVTALDGRVITVEGDVATLKTEMDAVEALAAANKLAHEANAAAVALKASQTDLDAAVGRIVTLETWHNNFTEASEEEINALFV